MNFLPAKFPGDVGSAKSFTVMDTSEYSVFLHLQHHTQTKPMGNIYVSDSSGKYFSESITNVVRGIEFVDFEKVNSLDGVFLANKLHFKNAIFSTKMGSNQNGHKTFEATDYLEEIAEEEMIDRL
mmetsp:Transcript_23888/g.23577  ORF Transcript_23888/g.23577 Transcript_23888/m.23577 type:complete len:125 (-) Transcript_23888:1218-1592(-)